MRDSLRTVPREIVDGTTLVAPARQGPVKIVTFDQVEHWAAARGIIFDGGNLTEVNAKRVQLGLPPFEVRMRRGGRRG